MLEFNDRAAGIFADGFLDVEGRPVRDTFAGTVRAALFGAATRDWSKARTAALIAAFDSPTLARLAEEGAAAFYPSTRAPSHPGVYLLACGDFARYANGIWYRASPDPVRAHQSLERAAFHSPEHRVRGQHRWIGPCHVRQGEAADARV